LSHSKSATSRSADCCLVDESCGAIITWNFAISTLNSDGKIHQYFKCKLTEVHEVFSSTSIIHVNAVKDIAFVFHLDVLEHKLPNCASKSRVFYTRYHYDIGNRLVSVDCHHHFPFSNIISESYPSRIWNSIIDIKEKLKSPSMIQSKISLESWNYIYISLVGSGAVVVYLEQKFTHKYMQCDLSMCSQRGKQCLTLLRLDSIGSLSAARYYLDSLLGLECETGLQTRVNPPLLCTMLML
jgi:hypothetical protein